MYYSGMGKEGLIDKDVVSSSTPIEITALPVRFCRAARVPFTLLLQRFGVGESGDFLKESALYISGPFFAELAGSDM